MPSAIPKAKPLPFRGGSDVNGFHFDREARWIWKQAPVIEADWLIRQPFLWQFVPDNF